MSFKQQPLIKRLENPLRGGKGKQSPVSPVSSAENPIFRHLKSKSKCFPTNLLKAMLSSPPSKQESSHPFLQSIEHQGIARCIKVISRDPGLKLCDLMKISGLSRRGLHKAFTTHLGCTPGTIIVMMRLWSACDLLVNSRLPVAQIATCCGYQNINSLYVAFQRFLGVTPVSVRRKSPACRRIDTKGNGSYRNTALLPAISDRVEKSILMEECR